MCITRWILGLTSLIIFLVMILGCAGGIRIPSDSDKATMNKFRQIHEGMDRDQVDEVMKCSGETMSDVVIGGHHADVVSYQNIDGSNCVIEFMDGKVVAKAQHGL
jgi:hypothetical protein